MNTPSKKLVILGLSLSLATLAAYTVYPGAPRWPFANGFHYIADLNTTSFPANSVWDANAQYSLSDWRDIGSTGFTPGYRRNTTSAFVNNDGINTWMWSNQPTQGWLGITYYRYSGGSMVEADIVFNSRVDYPWTNGLTDPCATRSYTPYNFRSVAQHECGHAIGLDHTPGLLATMNPIYERSWISHTGASGELPHADDKNGCRALYFGSGTTYNLMATCWRPTTSGQATRIPFGTTVQAGSQFRFPIYIESQSNTIVQAASTKLGVYLSTNEIISTGDTRIADVQFTGAWSAHGEAYYEFTVTVPASMPAGTYHVGGIIDWTNALGERFEGDNAARLGTINVTPAPTPPDLTVDAVTLGKLDPTRGETISLVTTVRNRGTQSANASSTYFYLSSDPNLQDATKDWLLAAVPTPAIVGNGSTPISIQVTIPEDVCAERTWYVHGVADVFNTVAESNENNNRSAVSIVPKWETTPGFRIGMSKRVVTAQIPDQLTICAKITGRTVTPTTGYVFVWSCSGNSPGIPIPPLGVLPINWDVCTNVGLMLEGSVFFGSVGLQSTAPQGSTFTMLGGSWLNPIQSSNVDFAALWFDAATTTFIGLSPKSLTVNVR
ncbi:MAG: matrixin family metalloprotease [Planctomycetes bacterium]|nr:matrixin family metalloprotease [Planctomycetota bacterium]